MSRKERIAELERLMAVGHCAKSQADLHNTHGDIKGMVHYYFYYIRQCIQKAFPSLEYMRTQLGAEAAQHGGYIDQHGSINQPQRDMAFIGNCQCQFTCAGYDIHRIWVQHNSQLDITATDNSHLFIDCFGSSTIHVRVDSPTAKVTVHLYGNSNCTVSGNTDRVKTTIHNQETY